MFGAGRRVALLALLAASWIGGCGSDEPPGCKLGGHVCATTITVLLDHPNSLLPAGKYELEITTDKESATLTQDIPTGETMGSFLGELTSADGGLSGGRPSVDAQYLNSTTNASIRVTFYGEPRTISLTATRDGNRIGSGTFEANYSPPPRDPACPQAWEGCTVIITVTPYPMITLQ